MSDLRCYFISVGCSSPLIDGKRARIVTGTAHAVDADAAARWLDANLPAVMARDLDEAQRYADAYAVRWASAASRLETTGDLVTPRASPAPPIVDGQYVMFGELKEAA